MNPDIPNALWISLIGMLLVFGAILLLWALMTLIARARPVRKEATETSNDWGMIDDVLLIRKRKAAAIAVALALAGESQDQPHEFPLPATAIVSAWQAVMRAQNMSKRGHVR